MTTLKKIKIQRHSYSLFSWRQMYCSRLWWWVLTKRQETTKSLDNCLRNRAEFGYEWYWLFQPDMTLKRSQSCNHAVFNTQKGSQYYGKILTCNLVTQSVWGQLLESFVGVLPTGSVWCTLYVHSAGNFKYTAESNDLCNAMQCNAMQL